MLDLPSRFPSRVVLAATLGGLVAMPLTHTAAPASPVRFLDALTAPGPAPEAGSNADLYDGLIGDWDGEVVDHLPGGTDRRQSVEMHFARVLEGRAIQDLWIAPAIRERGGAAPSADGGNRYGTTLRVYDPKIDAWRITWWNPVSGVETRLVGRRVGPEIVQTGSDREGRLVRWVFDRLAPDAFHWRGESSADGGRSWVCETEFSARRRATVPAARPGR
jgi:hypothetical protein